MTVIYNMSIDRADKPWIGDRRLTEDSVHVLYDVLVHRNGRLRLRSRGKGRSATRKPCHAAS